jgi:transglutaminase-like putative cysteine protease
MSETFLRTTRLLDYDAPSIQALVEARSWRALPTDDRIGAVYRFVRDEIAFGYNATDSLPASSVLADGYGQCNTKATLLMALLRAVGVPCRLHGATIHKSLQKGVVNGLFYAIAPTSIFHTWVEISSEGRWVGLEGVILDATYLRGVRTIVAAGTTRFLGFAVGTENLERPPVEWSGADTFIQSTGVNGDFGAYDDPDAFYRERGNNLSGLRAWLFAHWIRFRLNRNVARIRARAGAGAVVTADCTSRSCLAT